MRFRWPFTPNACGKKNRFELATYFLSRAWSLNSSTTFLNKVTVNKPCSLSSKTKLWKRTIGITEQVNLETEKYGPTKTRVLGYRPVALRGHVTNASFKQCVGILLIPKIDRAHKNWRYFMVLWFFNKVVWFVLAAMLEGKSMPSDMAANTNHTALLKNQSAIKYLP